MNKEDRFIAKCYDKLSEQRHLPLMSKRQSLKLF